MLHQIQNHSSKLMKKPHAPQTLGEPSGWLNQHLLYQGSRYLHVVRAMFAVSGSESHAFHGVLRQKSEMPASIEDLQARQIRLGILNLLIIAGIVPNSGYVRHLSAFSRTPSSPRAPCA